MKQDYRLFRLSRIRELELTDLVFSMQHEAAEVLMERQNSRDKRGYLHIKMLCVPEIRIWIEEYFPKATIVTEPSGQLRVECQMPEHERGWLGFLMSFGNQIKVLEPVELQTKLRQRAEEIWAMYH